MLQVQYTTDRFQEWSKEGVFRRMWIDGLSIYDQNNRIDWKWQAMDGGVITSTGPNPYHRQTEVNQVQSVVYWW